MSATSEHPISCLCKECERAGLKTFADYYNEVKKRAEAAKACGYLKPYAYSPCGYDDEDKAVSLDGGVAINPMPNHLASRVLAALQFTAASRTDVELLVKRCRALEEALKFARGSLAIDQSVACERIDVVLSAAPEEK